MKLLIIILSISNIMIKNVTFSIGIILCFSILLITGSPFLTTTNLNVKTDYNFPLEIFQFVYAGNGNENDKGDKKEGRGLGKGLGLDKDMKGEGGNKNNCPTQSRTLDITGKLNPKAIRLLGDFDPCVIRDGSVTLNILNNLNIKLAVMYLDKDGNNHASALINLKKIQNINNNQGLFKIELDQQMQGIDPLTKEPTIVTKINGLALYNIGNKPINFKSGNTVAYTAIFTK